MHLNVDLILVLRHKLEDEQFANILSKSSFFLKLPGIVFFKKIKEVNLLIIIRGNKHIRGKVLECLLSVFTSWVNFLFEFSSASFLNFLESVVDSLVGFCGLQVFFLMDVILNHELEVPDFFSFEASFTDSLIADLFTENVTADEIIAKENQLHLIKDEINFLFVFKTAICLNLNLLNDFDCLLYFAIGLVHLNELSGSCGIFTLNKHLAFGCLA